MTTTARLFFDQVTEIDSGNTGWTPGTVGNLLAEDGELAVVEWNFGGTLDANTVALGWTTPPATIPAEDVITSITIEVRDRGPYFGGEGPDVETIFRVGLGTVKSSFASQTATETRQLTYQLNELGLSQEDARSFLAGDLELTMWPSAQDFAYGYTADYVAVTFTHFPDDGSVRFDTATPIGQSNRAPWTGLSNILTGGAGVAVADFTGLAYPTVQRPDWVEFRLTTPPIVLGPDEKVSQITVQITARTTNTTGTDPDITLEFALGGYSNFKTVVPPVQDSGVDFIISNSVADWPTTEAIVAGLLDGTKPLILGGVRSSANGQTMTIVQLRILFRTSKALKSPPVVF